MTTGEEIDAAREECYATIDALIDLRSEEIRLKEKLANLDITLMFLYEEWDKENGN